MDEKFATTISKVLPFLVNIDQHQYYTQAVIFFDLIFSSAVAIHWTGLPFAKQAKLNAILKGFMLPFAHRKCSMRIPLKVIYS